jgi:hypothetical protein
MTQVSATCSRLRHGCRWTRMGHGHRPAVTFNDGRWRNGYPRPRGITAGQNAFPKVTGWRPQQDSNLRTRLRRPLLYPLSYGGLRMDDPAERTLAGTEQGYQPQGSAGHVLDLQA